MEMIIMTNGHIGISCFERSAYVNCGHRWKPYSSGRLLTSWGTNVGVPLNAYSAKKMGNFGSRIKALSNGESDSLVISGGLLEKEFEFKPSFDDYLKAMESVKDGGGKKQSHKSNGYKLKDEPRGSNASSLGQDARSLNLRRFKGSMDQKKISKVIGSDELVKHGDEATGQEDVNGGLVYKGRQTKEPNGKLGAKESSADANMDRKLKGTTGDELWLNNRTTSKLELDDSNKCKANKNGYTQKRPLISGGVKSSGKTFSMKQKLAHGTDLPELLERKTKVFKGEEIGWTGNSMSGRLMRNRVQLYGNTNKVIVQKDRTLSRNDPTFLDNSGDDELEVERAAFRQFEEFNDVAAKPRVSRMEMEERVQKLAKCLNGADIDMPEWMFSRLMRSAKIKFTDHTILRVIQILGNFGNWRRVLQVIEWLQMRERFKSHRLRYVYTTALDVLGKARRPVEALNIFYAMQQQMSSYPDLVAYHSIAVTLGQAGHVKELFDVIDSMRSPPKKKFKIGALGKWDPRLEPDIVVYHAVLNACVRRKQWEGAFWVLQQLKLQNIQPTTATYGLVMEVMFACGKYNLVPEFFRKAQKSSIPNALAFKVLVNTFWREGKTDEAVSAVKDMESRGIVGSAAIYYDLARCLCSAGRCEEALVQIEKICKVASKPLVVTYTGLIQACLDSGSIQNAVFIFNQVKNFCSPNLVTCNIMLKGYVEQGLFEEAKGLFNKMSEDGNYIGSKSDYKFRVIPDIYTFNTMLDACIAKKKWDDFEYVYERMLHHGFQFNGKLHLRMILDASKAGKVEPLEITWNCLALANRGPPPLLIKERFCVMLEKDDCDSALACITMFPTEGSQAISETGFLNLFKENSHRFRKDTLIRLMSKLVARSNLPDHPALQKLLTSCDDFLRTHFSS